MLACILGLGMKIPQSIQISTTSQALPWLTLNDLTIGWQNFNPLSHVNATLAPKQGKQEPVVTILTT